MAETNHFDDMLEERGIRREWADRTVKEPEKTENRDDGTRHFMRRIPEFGNRWLRVIVSMETDPGKRITAFFDRRLRRQHENQD